jgi:hypothetical protein
MQVKRKTISVLLLSPREIELLSEMIQEAKEGRTVHYSERETAPNQFFGVSIDEKHDSINQPRRKERGPVEYTHHASKTT